MPPQATAGQRYEKLGSERSHYLTEAWKSAKVTLPSLIPDDGDISQRTSPVELPKPFQSLGARGVNNLASKLLLTLLPPTSPFFRYELTSEARDEADEAGTDLADIQAALSRREGRIQTEVDIQGLRVKGYLVLKHLLVAGNVLVYLPPEGGMQVFPLNSYVCKRDAMGTIIDFIYVEKLDRETIEDPRVLDILRAQGLVEQATTEFGQSSDDCVKLYTHVKRTGAESWESYQEVEGVEVPETRQTWSADTLPWLVLRFTAIDGEDYGRGFVEEYRGDLTSYEQLSRDMIFASANAAKVIWMIDPTSTLKVKQFMDADNGQAVSGRDGDVVALRLDKGGDMSVAAQQSAELARALAADFLLNSSFQRSQERVTAEEIRRMAEELEDTLGGVFSLLSQEFQLPLAQRIERQLIARGDIPELPDDTVRIGVVTGLAAIGRGHDLQRLRDGLALIAEAAAVKPGLVDYIDEADLNTRIWTGTGVDTQGLLLSEDEVAQNRQQQQQAQAAAVAGQELAKGAGGPAGQAIVNQAFPQEADTEQ